MKKLINFSLIAFLLITNCKKSDNSVNGKFTISKVGGNTVSLNYTESPIPNNYGYFSLQYQKYGTGAKYLFFVLVDKLNDGGLNVEIPRTVQNNVTYTTDNNPFFSGNKVYTSLYGNFFNSEIDPQGNGKTEVIFESSSYPGKIKGSFKEYNSSGVLTHTGTFDFVAK